MNELKISSKSANFCGLRKVVTKALATHNDWKLVSTYGEKSSPLYINFDVFTNSKKVKQPLYKKIIQFITGKGKIVGAHNSFEDGSYEGVRLYKDGTRFDYSTFKYKTDYFGDKMGAKLIVTQRNGHKYTLQYDNAYSKDGKIIIPTLKSIKENNKKILKEFEEKHADSIKNLDGGY